jgi:regulator of extracellular matrix RemA (YlzA/DUF370 family)
MLPLRFIKVSSKRSDVKQFDVAICATRIVAMMSTDIYQARRTVSAEKKAGSLINACGTSATKTAIFLDNGAVVASPLTIPVLLNSIEKANNKAGAKQTARLKVYDVVDEEPKPEEDEEVDEISVYDDTEDDEDFENSYDD